MPERVVTGEHDDGTKANREREETLRHGRIPRLPGPNPPVQKHKKPNQQSEFQSAIKSIDYVDVEELGPVGADEEEDALDGSVEGGAADE